MTKTKRNLLALSIVVMWVGCLASALNENWAVFALILFCLLVIDAIAN